MLDEFITCALLIPEVARAEWIVCFRFSRKSAPLRGVNGVVPSERNPVRTKAVFDLMEHRFSFCRDFVLMGFRSTGTAF